MNDDDSIDTILITYETQVKIVRMIGGNLIPSVLKIGADVSPTEKASPDDLQNCMAKINFWFSSIVSRCVAFSYNNDVALSMFVAEDGTNRTDNMLLIAPGDPTDDMLAVLFQAKMRALCNGAIDFDVVDVKSDNSMGLGFTFIGQSLNILPTMEEWVGVPNFFDEPWWERNDGSTLDVCPPPEADLTKKPQWAFNLDAINKPVQGTVIHHEFRPTVIEGGKKD
jgi:hypothetical protein